MKTKILNILKNNTSIYISGEELSNQLGVSRTAIWKHIKTLRNEGFEIDSSTNRGYKLISESKELNLTGLNYIVESYSRIKFSSFLSEIDSTNQEAKRIALTNTDCEGIVIAEKQTLGKGRLGRVWTSEKKAGLWMSLLLRPNVLPDAASSITLVAATAMCEAIEKITGLSVGIKWPNDLVINGKKVCGILTEMSAELNQLHYVVLGIGVNLKQTAFDAELKEKATSLLLEGVDIDRKILLSTFLDRFFFYYDQFESHQLKDVMTYHKSHSVTMNREVVIISKDNQRFAQAIDLDENGSLIVINENGEKETIFFGEVSVRGINGYI